MHISRAQGTLLLAGYITYIVMGAFVFELLENDHHKRVETEIFQRKEEFLKNYTALSPEEVELFLVVRHYFSKTKSDDHGMTPENVMSSVQMGIDPVGDRPQEEHSSWDFANSFFFVGTMLATIGYGNLCPQTKEGQIFCVIYALFGIPFNLICLNYIGFLVSGLFERLAEKVHGKENKKSAVYITVFVAMGILMFLILPSFLFKWMEGWSYYEAVYFTFITLSTIGFGDYLIGKNFERKYFPGYRQISAIWIIMGLAWIAVLFELVSSLLAPVEPNESSQKESRGEK